MNAPNCNKIHNGYFSIKVVVNVKNSFLTWKGFISWESLQDMKFLFLISEIIIFHGGSIFMNDKSYDQG